MKKATQLKTISSFSLFFIAMIFFFLPCEAPAQQGAIKIGVVLPLSGGLEIYGKQGVQGAIMAVDEINKAGGVLNGRKVELVIEDNRSDTRVSVEKLQKLIFQDKVHAILGPVTSANRNAMISLMEEFKTPLLYATNYEGGSCSRYLLCYGMIPEHQLTPIIPYLIENYGNSFYLFGADYVWPRETNAIIKKRVAGHNGSIAGESYTRFGVKDFSSIIHSIRQSKADILITTLPGLDGQIFFQQCAQNGLKKKMKIVPMDFSDNYMESLSGPDAEGLMSCSNFIQSLDRPESRDFVARQKKMFGLETIVSFYADSHYGIVMMFIKAIEKAGSDDREKIIDAMPGISIMSGNGKVVMGKDHHVTLNMLISEVINGRLVQKKYIGPITPSPQCNF